MKLKRENVTFYYKTLKDQLKAQKEELKKNPDDLYIKGIVDALDGAVKGLEMVNICDSMGLVVPESQECLPCDETEEGL